MTKKKDAQNEFTQKGLPADFDAQCKWCHGTGDDGGGYRFCPDCESTGYKYGKQYEGYLDEELDLFTDLYDYVCRTLIEVYGYQAHFIPKYVINFCMAYFPDSMGSPYEVVKQTMISELSETFFEKKPVYVYTLQDDGLAYSIEGKPTDSKFVDVALIVDADNRHKPCYMMDVEIRLDKTVREPRKISYEELCRLPHDLNRHMEKRVEEHAYLTNPL